MRSLLAFTLINASGCLLVDATVTLSPAPTGVAVSHQPATVVLAPVSNRAHTSGRVGIKKTAMGLKSAEIHSSLPVATWFGRRLQNELAAAGLTVLETEPTAPRVEVTVLDFFAEPDVGMTFELHAFVHAEVVVQLPDGRRFARRFAQRRQTSALTLTGGLYEELFAEVVQAWMAEAVPSIVDLIDDGAAASVGPAEEEWRWLG